MPQKMLRTEFNLTLGSKGVNILDPCTGTGNFIVNLINRIPKKDLPRAYKEQLFANEVMLLTEVWRPLDLWKGTIRIAMKAAAHWLPSHTLV